MFGLLPPDVLLNVFSFLSLHDIAKFNVLSRDARRFLLDHESEVYHQLAVSCRFVPSGYSVKDAVVPEPWLHGVRTWKDLVKRWTVVERNWSGHGTVIETGYNGSGEFGHHSVRDFAVDEDDQTILTSFLFNILTVIAMKDNSELWQLSEVVSFRWSEGFLALINEDGHIEVWRRSTDVEFHRGKRVSTPILPPSSIAAIPSQYGKAAGVRGDPSIEYLTAPTYRHFRGQYVPHAFILTPSFALTQTLALRYPVVSFVTLTRPYKIHLYDIAAGTHIRSIDIEQVLRSHVQLPSATDVFMSHPPISLCLSETFVAVSFKPVTLVLPIHKADEKQFHPVIIYETQNPSLVQKSAYNLKKRPFSLGSKNYEEPFVFINSHRTDMESPAPLSTGLILQPNLDYIQTPGVLAMERFEVKPPTDDTAEAYSGALVLQSSLRQAAAKFTSVQISPDERHLVIVTKSGLLYLLPDLIQVAKGSKTVENEIQKIQISTSLTSVTWSKYSRHFAVKSDQGDTYIIDINPTRYSPFAPQNAMPSLQTATIHRLSDFRMSNIGAIFTWMEFTRTRLWLLWDPRVLFEVAKKREKEIKRLRSRKERLDGLNESSILPEFNPRSYRSSVCFIDFMPEMV